MGDDVEVLLPIVLHSVVRRVGSRVWGLGNARLRCLVVSGREITRNLMRVDDEQRLPLSGRFDV